MKKTIRLLSLLLAFCFICSLFTACNQNVDEELIARNNAIVASGFPLMTDEVGGIYGIGNFKNACYIDTHNATSAPVCGKPECTHDDKEICFAVRSAKKGQEFYYYQDHLYYTETGTSLLYQSDSIGNNQKVLADFSKLMRGQIDSVLRENEKFISDTYYINIGGVYDEKLYVLVQVSFGREIIPAFFSNAYVELFNLFTYDFKTGSIKRCEDEMLRPIIEGIPHSNLVCVSICGDLLIIARNTTEREQMPVPEGFFEAENWIDVWIENNSFIKETPGHMEYRAYNLKSKEVVKEWSDPNTLFDSIRINEDETFLYAEKSDGKVIYTEYNDDCEKTAAFTLDENVALAKHDGVYYEVADGESREILRYDPKTGKTDVLKTDGTFVVYGGYGVFGILNDQMLVRYISKAEHEFGLLDLSSFDTGEVKIRPVEGASRTNMDE